MTPGSIHSARVERMIEELADFYLMSPDVLAEDLDPIVRELTKDVVKTTLANIAAAQYKEIVHQCEQAGVERLSDISD
jgi:hypothetical protein